jgi:hypothetical protein
VWVSLFEGNDPTNTGAVFFRVAPGREIPVWCCSAVLLLLGLASLAMLARKIRGVEVVR